MLWIHGSWINTHGVKGAGQKSKKMKMKLIESRSHFQTKQKQQQTKQTSHVHTWILLPRTNLV